MAKLPYIFTICPTQEAPKQYTAMTKQLVNALKYGNDLTIDQRRYIWPCGSSDFEGKLSELIKTAIKERGET